MLLGGGCASLGRDARLYALEEKLRIGGSDVPSIYEADGKRYTIQETNGYFLIRDEEGRGALFTYPKEVNSRLIKNAQDLGQSLEGLARDFVDGSEFLYLDEHKKLQKGRNTGLLENLLKFLQHLASAITFGLYVPEGEEKPEGAEHLLHVPKALFQAVGDLAFGVPLSIGNMARHAIAAGVQMVQFVPILTIGHSEEAGEVSAQVFDYLQVTLRTAANAIPLIGEGWQRTAATGFHQGEWFPPVAYYAMRDRQTNPDTVELTPFRKILEIILALGATAVAIWVSVKNTNDSSRRGGGNVKLRRRRFWRRWVFTSTTSSRRIIAPIGIKISSKPSPGFGIF